METFTVAPDEYTALESSGLVTLGPCVFKGIVIASDEDSGYCDVYDAVNTGGRRAIRVRFAANGTRFIGCPCGVKFEFGIYVDFASHVQHCFVMWRHRGEGE